MRNKHQKVALIPFLIPQGVEVWGVNLSFWLLVWLLLRDGAKHEQLFADVTYVFLCIFVRLNYYDRQRAVFAVVISNFFLTLHIVISNSVTGYILWLLL